MAENRREKAKRYYYTRGQMVLLGSAFALTSVIIFGLGMFVGKEIEARKLLQPEEPLVKVPVKPPQASEGGRGKDDLTFYNTLTKDPASQQAAGAKPEGKEAEKAVKPGATEKKTSQQEPTAARAKVEDSDAKDEGKIWNVQANSYPDTKSANDLVDRLKNNGYNAFVTEANVKGKVWYRVRIGPFASREEAEKTVTALKNKESLANPFATRK
jgi:cell division septation protein DedD